MIRCDKCGGKGYTIHAYLAPTVEQGVWKEQLVQVRCKECHGRGEKPYEGDRTGWEGE